MKVIYEETLEFEIELPDSLRETANEDDDEDYLHEKITTICAACITLEEPNDKCKMIWNSTLYQDYKIIDEPVVFQHGFQE